MMHTYLSWSDSSSSPPLYEDHSTPLVGQGRVGPSSFALGCYDCFVQVFENGGTFPDYRHVEADLFDLKGLIKSDVTMTAQ